MLSATIKDVARAAGVSVATVSRSLNGSDKVLPETRARIAQIAHDLRYAPSAAARSLIMRRTDTLGALLPDLHGEFFSELIRGIDQAARGRRLHLLLSGSHGDAEEIASALRAMNGRVDGLLVMSPHVDGQFLSRHLPANLPAVLINPGALLQGHRSFAVDNYGGARAMTAHLLARGHRRIAFVQGPQDNFEARERQRGYREALPPGLAPQLLPGDFTEAGGRRAAAHLATLPREQWPDALFCANDITAIGVLAALAEAGLSVPQDIAVAGFDDIPIARYVRPALSTVHVPIAALGAQALDALAEACSAHGSSGDAARNTAKKTQGDPGQDAQAPATLMPVQLVLRESCTRSSSP